MRLGSRPWCGIAAGAGEGPELWLTRPDHAPVRFAFRDQLRADAAAVVAALQGRGLEVELLSGDRTPVVAEVARALGIERWQAGCSPADKALRLEQLAGVGRRVLMVGDGLNDAPALAGAHVSLSPASAADVSQTVADAVFQGERLHPVLELLEIARRADRLIRQNFGLALAYNLITIPLAIAGLVTPLVAALCMSASSLVVVGNGLRLRIGARR
jgi:Cu2+-exporting ATPase